MWVIAERGESKKLNGLIEVDDAYLGGQNKGGKRGCGSENKQPFIVAFKITAKNHPIDVKLTPVRAFTKKEISKWWQENPLPWSYIATDGLNYFNAFNESNEI